MKKWFKSMRPINITKKKFVILENISISLIVSVKNLLDDGRRGVLIGVDNNVKKILSIIMQKL